MGNVKILDCTLRDGGYINDWRFGRQAIGAIISKLGDAGIEIVECGFLRDEPYDVDRSVFSDVCQIVPFLKNKRSGAKYFAMIALGDIAVENIVPQRADSIDGIRLTFHKDDWAKAKAAIRELIEKGYEVCVQPVGTTSYSECELLSLIDEVNKLRPFAFYIVDTLGILYARDLMKLFHLVDSHLDKCVAIGFHSHNNLQLSFSNAQAIMDIKTDRGLIVDTSVYGMGRGVGNLATELLAKYINDNHEFRYAILPLLAIVDSYLLSIHARSPWGYALPYFLSGTVRCHPNYATYLANRGTLSVEDISKVLEQIPAERRALYDKPYIKKLYEDYQQNSIDDKVSLALLRTKVEGRTVLLVAPGQSLQIYELQVRQFQAKHNVVTIAVNLKPLDLPFDMVFISNRKRAMLWNDDKVMCLVTSNLGGDAPVGALQFNYNDYLGEGDERDNAGAMLVRILRSANVAGIALAGFDGFTTDATMNYFSDKVGDSLDAEMAKTKNEQIGRQLSMALQGLEYRFLTPTLYVIK